MSNPPLRAAIVPVTPLQQNCSLLWCTASGRGAFVDPGGDLPKLKAAMAHHGVSVEKIILTHGHIDHCGEAGTLAAELGVPIEGPHEADRFWIARLDEDGRQYGIPGRVFEPDRWLNEGDQVTVGELTLDVYHTPGHAPGHVIYFNRAQNFAHLGDVLFNGSIGRTDLPGGNHRQLLDSIRDKVLPLGDDVGFICGHGPGSRIGDERRSNLFLREI